LGCANGEIDKGQLTATLSGDPPVVTFVDKVDVADRHKLDAVIDSVTTINAKLKEFDQQVGLSKSYLNKSHSGAAFKPNQGRVSPIDGESEIRWKMRDGESTATSGGGRRGTKSSSSKSSGNSVDGTRFIFNDKMED